MKNSYEINIIHPDGSKDCLGRMEERHVTHNRYSEGLLIGAGRLHNSDLQKAAFIKAKSQHRNNAELEFIGKEQTYSGTFCFINFLPEIDTVVFGSIGPVIERCSRTGRLIEKEKDPESEETDEKAQPETVIAA